MKHHITAAVVAAFAIITTSAIAQDYSGSSTTYNSDGSTSQTYYGSSASERPSQLPNPPPSAYAPSLNGILQNQEFVNRSNRIGN